MAPKKSRAGLFVGIAALLVALGVGAFVVFGGGGGGNTAPAVPVEPDAGVAMVEDTAPAPPPEVVAPPPVDAAPVPEKAEGVLLFAGVPPGMKVFIDGQLLFENSTATAMDFPARRTVEGEHTIRFEHPEYVADETSMTLDAASIAPAKSYGDGWTVELGAFVRPLAEDEVYVFLTLMDEDAELRINDVAVPYRAGEEVKVRARLADGNVTLDVTKRGHETVHRVLRPTAPGEVRLQAGIYLARQGGGPGPRPDAGGPPPPSGTGSLRVRCEPWAAVTVPGHGTRNTPFSMDLPAGNYRLQFNNPDEGRSNSQSITISPNDTVKITDCW